MSGAEIHPKTPDSAWLRGFVVPSLVAAAPYKIDTPNVTIKLDQNESPWDLPRAIKEKVLARLVSTPWNRYPPAFADELAAKVARYAGVPADSVLLGPGSNYLVSLALSTLVKGILKGRGKLVVARPSFPLYESHSTYEGIPYEPWNLNTDLEYDVALLPPLPPGSLVVFASPNNPVGNVLPKAAFSALLSRHPDTLFLADEAYYEYASEPYTDLIARHSNLILLRTFSKTMGAAGVRIGYFIAHPDYLALLRKLRLPYLLNHFALACADVLLTDGEMAAHLEAIRKNAVRERQTVHAELAALASAGGFQVKASEANFLLVRWPTTAAAQAVYKGLVERSILVRDISSNPGLAGCLRITLGDERENAALVGAMKAIVSGRSLAQAKS
jgi:histidinol-phosphate aminotransferase